MSCQMLSTCNVQDIFMKNLGNQYSGLEFRQLFWAASKASYPQLFKKIMDKIKSANPNADKYLMDKNPKTWPKAFFEVDRGCEAIENGFSECFNSVIVSVRHKPLLTMLEAIRVIVLERMNKIREISRKWNLGVRSGSEGFTVDEGKKTCSYRMWQLSRILCFHATKDAGGSRGGAGRSRGGVGGSRGGASRSKRKGVGGSRGGA
ncbi:hypothetical protein Tco_1543216, partial [Tanacetum coccineum]